MPFLSRFRAAATFAAILALGVSCSNEPSSSPGGDAAEPENTTPTELRSSVGTGDDKALIARGNAIVQQAFSVLSANLSSAMQQGGVTNAIQFCSVHAIPLTSSLSRTNQVRITRVSHRPRNPANTASLSEKAWIDQYKAALASGTELEPRLEESTVVADEKVFYAPIVLLNPVCLNCHGDPETDLAANTRELLARLYPDDSATGFKLGDVRGLWRVEFRD